MRDYQTKGCSRYGASMGRLSDHIDRSYDGNLRIRLVPIDSGGYDPGGAYWGVGGSPLFYVWTDEGEGAYFRAKSVEAARAEYPLATFVRDSEVDESDVRDAVSGFVEAALFLSPFEREEPEEEDEDDRSMCHEFMGDAFHEGDIDPESLKVLASIVEEFVAGTAAILLSDPCTDWELVGKALWLQSQGYGGFYEWPLPERKALQDAANIGDVSLYADLAGKVFVDYLSAKDRSALLSAAAATG